MKIPNTTEDYPEFQFKSFRSASFFYKQASGELRVPSLVTKERNRKAQQGVSRGTGEHAGHLIGTQFGGPGGVENLGLQNPNMNSYAPTRLQEAFGGAGGAYLVQETAWSHALETGHRIRVIVEDKYRTGETRFIGRSVQWWVMAPGGGWEAMPTLDFGNWNSPQAPTAANRKFQAK